MIVTVVASHDVVMVEATGVNRRADMFTPAGFCARGWRNTVDGGGDPAFTVVGDVRTDVIDYLSGDPERIVRARDWRCSLGRVPITLSRGIGDHSSVGRKCDAGCREHLGRER